MLAEFFTLQNDCWLNKRAEAEIAKKETKVKAAQANGARGGRPKKRGPGSENETQQKPTGLLVGSENETQQKAHQSPVTSHQSPVFQHAPLECKEGGPVGPARASPAGVVCLAIRGQGIADGNPSHPDLLALIAAGAGVDVFIDAAVQAVAKRKGFAYVLGTVKGRMADAAKTAAAELSIPQSRTAQSLSFAQQDEQARRRRWEEMTGQQWPESAPAGECFDAENVTPINPKRISA